MFYYLFLVLAIIGELIGTNLLKMSMGFTKILPTIGSLISFALCFYFLSIAMVKIPLNIAYANWSALGILATTAIASLVYKEQINIMRSEERRVGKECRSRLNLFSAK